MLEERGERIGEATNNVAEYRALLLGIERAAALGASELELVGDSELIVKQIKGEYKVKDAGMRKLHAEAKRGAGELRELVDPPRAPRAERRGRPAGQRGAGCPEPIDPGVDVGHVHLKVADLDRALGFYRGVLGFELTQRLGDDAAFVSAGGYHHHIGLNTWHSKDGSPPPPGTTGLFHLAIRYPTRAALADALDRLRRAGVPLEGASDHGVSEALYLSDPDGNGVELYWDRPREQWPRAGSGEKVGMYTRPLDLHGLLAEID